MVPLETALNISMGLTVLGMVCASIRLIIGPSRADRVVALDLITILLVAIAAQLALIHQFAAYLDLGLAIALIGFLATVAFARYIETAPEPKEPEAYSNEATVQQHATGNTVETPHTGEARQ